MVRRGKEAGFKVIEVGTYVFVWVMYSDISLDDLIFA